MKLWNCQDMEMKIRELEDDDAEADKKVSILFSQPFEELKMIIRQS